MRVGNKIAAGFFATPLRQAAFIKRSLHVKGGPWLDPTAGEGEALAYLAEGHDVQTYGVEIDKSRAQKAEQVLTKVLHAPVETLMTSQSFSMLFCNPPYDYGIKALGEEAAVRKELSILGQVFQYLIPNGLLIYIVPAHRLGDPELAKFLTARLESVKIYRFTDEDFHDYRQVVLFGYKKRSQQLYPNQNLYWQLRMFSKDDYIMTIPTLADMQEQWEVPKGKPVRKFVSNMIEPESFFGIDKSVAYRNFQKMISFDQLEVNGIAPMPLKQGQLALLLASGAMNGLVGSGDTLHVVQGVEQVTEKRVEDEEETRTWQERAISVKVLTPSGNIKKFV